MGFKDTLASIYDKQYKKLIVLSFLILLASIGFLVHSKLTTGEFVEKGVSLKGGLTLTIPTEQADIPGIQANLDSRFPKADITVRSITEAAEIKALIVESSDVEEAALIQALRTQGFPMETGEYSVEIMGSSLGQSFFKQTIIAVIVAFIFMGMVVFIAFRSLLPSLFVILAAGSDIIGALAVIGLLGIKLSTAGIAAILMIIGYSVDTNILLTTKVLKRKEGTILDRTFSGMRTGVLMSLTSFSATMIAFIFTQSDVIKQIMLIISIGLLFDIIYTWLQNAGILRWYLERKQGGGANRG